MVASYQAVFVACIRGIQCCIKVLCWKPSIGRCSAYQWLALFVDEQVIMVSLYERVNDNA